MTRDELRDFDHHRQEKGEGNESTVPGVRGTVDNGGQPGTAPRRHFVWASLCLDSGCS